MSISKMLAYIKSDEGQKALAEEARKLVERKAIEKKQLKRFHKKYGDRFDAVIEYFLVKCDSKKYQTLHRGDPPLLYFFFDYAAKYGRKAKKAELKKYSNIFTHEMYFIKGYYFNLMLGQGSAVLIHKAE